MGIASRHRAGQGTLLLLLSLLGCGDGATTPSGPPQRLVYNEMSIGDTGQIVLVTADGKQRQVLWRGVVATQLYPSADGESVLFISLNEGWQSVPTAGGPASPFQEPSNGGFFGVNPVWSPDGTSIAWVMASDEVGAAQRLGVASPGNAHAEILTPDSLDVSSVSWSPNGDELAFCAYNRAVNATKVWAISRDGTGLRPLSPDSLPAACEPSWSPSGGQIAFAYGYLWGVTPDGTGLRHLTESGEYRGGIFWSPNSRMILATDVNGGDLHRVNVVTGAETNTHQGGFGGSPWSPDGQWIAVVGQTPVDTSVFHARQSVRVQRPDGSSSVQVTPDTVDAYGARWVPLPD